MKIAVVGSGAMGQLFGARLARGGNDVSFVDANPQVVERLNADGITLDFGTGTTSVVASATTAADARGIVDLVMMFTKGFHTEAALESIGHLVGKATFGLTLQNGLGNDVVLEQQFGSERTLIGMTDLPADLIRPGLVRTRREGKVAIGGTRGAMVAQGVRETFSAAGFTVAETTDVRVPIWEKVAFNSALNTISALTRQTVGQIGTDGGTRALVENVVDEVVDVAHAEGVDIDNDRIMSAVSSAFAHHTDHKTSMLGDIESGRRTEIDNIAGAVVQRGRDHHVETPVLDVLCTLVRSTQPS